MTSMDVASKMEPFFAHLIRRPCSDIRPRKENRTTTVWEYEGAVTCTGTTPLHEAFRKLQENNITAMPVIAAVGERYIGVISLPMILHWVITQFDARWGRNSGESSSDWAKELKWRETTAAQLLLSMPLRQQPAITKDHSLFFAFELLARQNLKQIAIVSPVDRHVTGVFTMSMALGEIYNKMNDGTITKEMKALKVRDMSGSWIVSSVRETQLAITAFRMMNEKRFSGVAIVDSLGKLTGVLSHRDIKAVQNDQTLFSRIYMTVNKFKQLSLEHQPKGGRKAPSEVLFATRDTSMFDVVKMMDEHNLHRIIIVDDATSMIPIQMLSVVDIMTSLLPSPLAYVPGSA